MTVTGGGVKTVLAYLCEDRGAGKLAQFSVVTGSGVIGDFVGSGPRHRLVHRLMLCALAPSLPDYVDQLILPDTSADILDPIMTFLYDGRRVIELQLQQKPIETIL